jgi:hypothetical protein
MENGSHQASVVYSWKGRRIQPLQRRARYDFEYLGVLDPSRFSADKMFKSEAVRRVSRVLLDVDTVPYLPKLLNVKNPPKQVRVSDHCPLLGTFSLLMLTYTNHI